MNEFRAILTYHSIDDSGSVVSTSPNIFSLQMRSLFERGIRVALPAELLGPADDGYPALALTFDDGFANFYTRAFPTLADLKLRATVFLVPGFCGGSSEWGGQPATFQDRELLSWSHVEELHRSGVRFGAHTMTHPPLTGIKPERARAEILESKKRIEDRIGGEVEAFAYPYGAESPTLRGIVAETFRVGCSTRLGYLTSESPPESLERIDAYYLRNLFLFRRLFRRSAGAYLSARGLLRSWKTKVLGPY